MAGNERLCMILPECIVARRVRPNDVRPARPVAKQIAEALGATGLRHGSALLRGDGADGAQKLAPGRSNNWCRAFPSLPLSGMLGRPAGDPLAMGSQIIAETVCAVAFMGGQGGGGWAVDQAAQRGTPKRRTEQSGGRGHRHGGASFTAVLQRSEER
jgi:hypothetical protein